MFQRRDWTRIGYLVTVSDRADSDECWCWRLISFFPPMYESLEAWLDGFSIPRGVRLDSFFVSEEGSDEN